MKKLIRASRNDRDYFGQEAAEKYGDLIVENLSGKKISKRRDLAEEPGGLIYEANQLGIDMWDLLEALEGLCHEGKAREIDDSTYFVNAKIMASTDKKQDTLKQRLLDAGYPLEDMYHHDSDLYVYVTPLTTKVIQEWCDDNGYRMAHHCPKFRDAITGRPMYDCAFNWYT